MKKSIKILSAAIIFSVGFYNFSLGNNKESTKTIFKDLITVALADSEAPPKCDTTEGAFCKNTPGSNIGVCETQTKGVCCVFTTQANKDCWDATH